MLRPMRLARLWRVGWAVRMSRLGSSRAATASHMSFGTSGVEALLARLLVDAVKTGHLLDLEAQYLHMVSGSVTGVGPQPRVSLFWMVFFAFP